MAEEDLDETKATADRVAAWLSLLRKSMNVAMITAGTRRIDAISPPRKCATMCIMLVLSGAAVIVMDAADYYDVNFNSEFASCEFVQVT